MSSDTPHFAVHSGSQVKRRSFELDNSVRPVVNSDSGGILRQRIVSTSESGGSGSTPMQQSPLLGDGSRLPQSHQTSTTSSQDHVSSPGRHQQQRAKSSDDDEPIYQGGTGGIPVPPASASIHNSLQSKRDVDQEGLWNGVLLPPFTESSAVDGPPQMGKDSIGLSSLLTMSGEPDVGRVGACNGGVTSDTVPLLADDASFGSDVDEQEDVSTVVPSKDSADESSFMIGLQVLFPYLVAGAGMVAAGLVLDQVQHWTVFTEVSEIFILIPALLGLKGNLEMTLASRLSTQANLGRMDTRAEKLTHIGGNMALIQAQALVVAFLASTFAITLGWIPKGRFSIGHAFLLCASSMTTAAVASFILGSIMIAVVILSRQLRVNPDNVATPIAASLGDITTLVILACIGSVLNHAKVTVPWLAPVIVIFWIVLIPVWCFLSARNRFTCPVLIDGWTPVVAAMMISSAGGFILDLSVSTFHGIAVFQPVINGVGGNLVAVQASRLSTWLHGSGAPMGQLPDGNTGEPGQTTGSNPALSPSCLWPPSPLRVFFSGNVHSRAARVLLLLVVPGHLIFIFLIDAVKAGHTSIDTLFTLIYMAAAIVQVSLLLYICAWMVRFMWIRHIDPDNSAIPYLTAMGDLLGTGLLALVFLVLHWVGHDKQSNGDELDVTTGHPIA